MHCFNDLQYDSLQVFTDSYISTIYIRIVLGRFSICHLHIFYNQRLTLTFLLTSQCG